MRYGGSLGAPITGALWRVATTLAPLLPEPGTFTEDLIKLLDRLAVRLS